MGGHNLLLSADLLNGGEGLSEAEVPVFEDSRACGSRGFRERKDFWKSGLKFRASEDWFGLGGSAVEIGGIARPYGRAVRGRSLVEESKNAAPMGRHFSKVWRVLRKVESRPSFHMGD